QFIPFIIFLFFIAVPVTTFTLEQDKITVTKGSGKTARINCKYVGSGFESAYIHWYQKKENEAMRRILYIQSIGGTAAYDNDKDKSVFKASKSSNSESELRIENLQNSHSATYYCACWDTHSEILYSIQCTIESYVFVLFFS
uniref:Ig-like domain-containing protein n=1 Tax=Lepisosteus oculatus TaxID=7918 RepID=W5N035_LEPOC